MTHADAHARRIAAVRLLHNVVKDGSEHLSDDEVNRATVALAILCGSFGRRFIFALLMLLPACATPTAPTPAPHGCTLHGATVGDCRRP